jgi:hypothetical protein
MKKIVNVLVFFSLSFSQLVFSCSDDAKEGILPKNDLSIPIETKDRNTLSEEKFNSIIEKIQHIYAPLFSQMGGTLRVEKKWIDGTVNAYAERQGVIWKVIMYGGLARHMTITPDGFALVMCHEIGHHLGGFPRYSDYHWASNEGEADYFGALKCLRRIWQFDNNSDVARTLKAPTFLVKSCEKNWPRLDDQNLCIRVGMAGDSVSRLFSAVSTNRWIAKFHKPDPKVVKITLNSHPATQCRLDTYFQASLCEKSFEEDLGPIEEISGACHSSSGQTVGLRPRCWFKPAF